MLFFRSRRVLSLKVIQKGERLRKRMSQKNTQHLVSVCHELIYPHRSSHVSRTKDCIYGRHVFPRVVIASLALAGRAVGAMKSNGQAETVDEWRGRVLQAKIGLTMGIDDVSLRFGRHT